jgi:hypothetical protein
MWAQYGITMYPDSVPELLSRHGLKRLAVS